MNLADHVKLPRASARILHTRPKLDEWGVPIATRLLADGSVDLDTVEVLHDEVVHNVITNAGRDFLHTQGYGTSPAANGLNFIALSNDTVTETATSTTLSAEIAANGLSRAAGTPAHTAGTNTSTITKTFTATGAQSAQKAALFTASSAGTMNHVLGFTQRSLQTNDTLQVTFTITLG